MVWVCLPLSSRCPSVSMSTDSMMADLTGTPGAQSLDKIYPRKVLFRQR